MSEKRTEITPELEEVLAPYWDEVDPLIASIQEDLHRREKYPMQISREQARFHAWFCGVVGARRILEVGTSLGLSATAFAQAIGPGGHIDTVEIDPEHADIAESWFRTGGISDRITVHRGAALEVVPNLAGPYDLCFLDGAKEDNVALLELCIERTRPGGVILVDNAFRGGNLTVKSTDPADLGTIADLDYARTSDRLDNRVVRRSGGSL